MAFPVAGATITETEETTARLRAAWTAVARAISDYEPVTMVVDPADVALARQMLGDGIDILEAPLDDAWMRDIGPTFVFDENGVRGSVEWVFNGWGQQEWAAWGKDSKINRFVSAAAGTESIVSSLVNEGGGIHVDGLGTVLVTETVQLDPGRNPGITKAEVEAELARTIGATHVVWVPRGLTRDSERFGTRGHIDIVATIPSPGRLLVHVQNDETHPDHAVTREILAALRASTDATGREWTITEVPAPQVLRDEEGWVDYSYINHVVINGAVIACGFADPHDEQARELLADAYPGREIVMIDARDIFGAGGGIHCITQQQPCG